MIHKLTHEGEVPAAQLAAPGEALPECNPLRGPTLFTRFSCKDVYSDASSSVAVDPVPCKGAWDILRT